MMKPCYLVVKHCFIRKVVKGEQGKTYRKMFGITCYGSIFPSGNSISYEGNLESLRKRGTKHAVVCHLRYSTMPCGQLRIHAQGISKRGGSYVPFVGLPPWEVPFWLPRDETSHAAHSSVFLFDLLFADSGTNQHEVEEARVTVDTVVQEISSRFRDLQKRNTARNNSSSGGGGDAPVTANSRGKGNAGTTPHDGRQTRHNETGDVRSRERDGGSLSLMDAEGGTAGYQSGVDGESEALLAPGADDVRIGNVGHPAGEADEDYGPEDLVFPRELGQLPRQLFHLRRGPLLGPLLQNADDPLCLRHLFLRGALEECLRLMAPAMLSLKVGLSLLRVWSRRRVRCRDKKF